MSNCKLVVICVLLFVAIAYSAESDCEFDGVTIKRGEWRSAPIGKCQKYTCNDDGSIGSLGCGVFQVAANCHKTDYDYTKPYPDCCPKSECN